MADPMNSELADLLGRVNRLEAAECCRSRFNEYLYALDSGRVDDLMGLFASDARLELMNFPPGSGQDPLFSGVDEIRKLYSAFAGEGARHHSANVSVVVNEAVDRVDVTAYFQTTIEYTLTGGIYELELQPRDTGWQITRMRISSTWGWAVPHTDPPFLKEHFAAGTLRDGRPPTLDGSN
jgi:hypothetical protein